MLTDRDSVVVGIHCWGLRFQLQLRSRIHLLFLRLFRSMLSQLCTVVLLLVLPGATCLDSMKRGLADIHPWVCDDFLAGAGNLSFAYNWNVLFHCDYLRQNKLFVPMIWGAGTLQMNLTNYSYFNAPALLGFNEPNHDSQSNMSPQESARLWPKVEHLAHKWNISRIGSPAAAPCGSGCNGGSPIEWFTHFFNNCTDCKVDFLATHYYGCEPGQLQSYLDSLKVFNRSIWLTEFNCGCNPAVPLKDQLRYMRQALTVLESDPAVERYSWFCGHNTFNPRAALFTTVPDGRGGTVVLPTELGQLYLSFSI